jgi:hypothetical protein
MKKFTFLLLCFSSISFQAAIVVKDIPDYTFTSGGILNFDFNSDATTEFAFEEMGGSVGGFFDSNNVNFVGTGTFASGHGWDIIKFLSSNTLISSASVFDAQGDAYINPFWANTNELFPAGDSYVGVKFKLGSNTHYGWILINSTGGASGAIKIKSYAYNDIADQSITAGQLLGAVSFVSFSANIFPIPSSDKVTIASDKTIVKVYAFDYTGKKSTLVINNNSVSIAALQKGTYLLHLITDDENILVQKIIKN